MMNIAAWLIRQTGMVFALFPKRKRIALLSRQSRNPLDFVLLKPYLEKAFPDYDIVQCCVKHIGKLGVLTLLKQLWLSSTSVLCIVDGYVPAVCIPRDANKTSVPFPPCVQMWHALGAIKKFGYQSLDTKAGRSSKAAEAFSMHRGYVAVIAGFSGAVPAFGQAFGYKPESVLPLGLPRIDYLVRDSYAEKRAVSRVATRRRLGLTSSSVKDCPVVLYAPTFRKNPLDANWHARYIDDLYRAIPEDMILVVSGHPLDHADKDTEADRSRLRFLRSSASIGALEIADYVVTDYSAVAFEAMLLGKKVLFYVPDIDEYRQSPGLNIDVERELGTVTFRDAPALGAFLQADHANTEYDWQSVRAFTKAYGIDAARESSDSACTNITNFLLATVDRSCRASQRKEQHECSSR